MSSYWPATQNQIALLEAANRRKAERSKRRNIEVDKNIVVLDNAQLKTQRQIEELQKQINELKTFKDATDGTLQHINSNYAKLDERVDSNIKDMQDKSARLHDKFTSLEQTVDLLNESNVTPLNEQKILLAAERAQDNASDARRIIQLMEARCMDYNRTMSELRFYMQALVEQMGVTIDHLTENKLLDETSKAELAQFTKTLKGILKFSRYAGDEQDTQLNELMQMLGKQFHIAGDSRATLAQQLRRDNLSGMKRPVHPNRKLQKRLKL